MAEVEERFNRIIAHKGIVDILIVGEDGKILKRNKRKDGNETIQSQIAKKVTELAKRARSVVRDINPNNDLTFFRVRSKKQEIMVAPDKNLFLIVIQVSDDKEKEVYN